MPHLPDMEKNVLFGAFFFRGHYEQFVKNSRKCERDVNLFLTCLTAGKKRTIIDNRIFLFDRFEKG